MIRRMTPSVTESWIRIETWLAEHAPKTFAALAPPAERSDVAAVERALGRPLPEPLTESLLRHDGTGHRDLLLPFWSLLDTKGIADARSLRMRIHGDGLDDAEEGDPDEEYGPWWHPLWVPFAANGAGDYLVIDQRQHRRTGRIGNADHETGCWFRPHPLWASLPALLDATATALETGEVVDGCRRVVVDETELDWEIV